MRALSGLLLIITLPTVVVLASLLACSQPSDQGEPARIAWSRAVGFVDEGGTASTLSPFPTASALVRLHGRGFTGDLTFERTVTVRP